MSLFDQQIQNPILENAKKLRTRKRIPVQSISVDGVESATPDSSTGGTRADYTPGDDSRDPGMSGKGGAESGGPRNRKKRTRGKRGGSGYLDPESEGWLRDLLKPTDTSAFEDEARSSQERGLARGRADMDARAGMAGMGLAGGQIALGTQMERESATDLANQILGIKENARKEDLQRGGMAADFLDRGEQRKQDAEMMEQMMKMLGVGDDDDDDVDPADADRSMLTPEQNAALDEEDAARAEDKQKEAAYGHLPEAGFWGNVAPNKGKLVDQYRDESGQIWYIHESGNGRRYRYKAKSWFK